jgi:hypothetical protein
MSSTSPSSSDEIAVTLLGLACVFGDPAVTRLLWRWFAVPLGLPPLTYWHVFGLSVLIGVFVWQYKPNPKTFEQRNDRASAHAAMLVLALGVGWLVHFGM